MNQFNVSTYDMSCSRAHFHRQGCADSMLSERSCAPGASVYLDSDSLQTNIAREWTLLSDGNGLPRSGETRCGGYDRDLRYHADGCPGPTPGHHRYNYLNDGFILR